MLNKYYKPAKVYQAISNKKTVKITTLYFINLLSKRRVETKVSKEVIEGKKAKISRVVIYETAKKLHNAKNRFMTRLKENVSRIKESFKGTFLKVVSLEARIEKAKDKMKQIRKYCPSSEDMFPLIVDLAKAKMNLRTFKYQLPSVVRYQLF